MTSASSAPDAETVARWRSQIREETFANHALCMGLAIHGSGAPADAVPFLRKALSYSALRAESWFALVQALRDAGLSAQADAAEAEARGERGDFALAAQVGLARRLMETPVIPADWTDAFLSRAQTMAVAAGNGEVAGRLFILHLLFLCRTNRAEHCAERWKTRPALGEGLDGETRPALALPAVELARALVAARLPDLARQILDLIIRRLDPHALSGSDLVAVEVPLLDALGADWDPALAATLFDIADQDPVSPLASFLCNLGVAAIRQDDAELARRAFEAGHARAPDNLRVRQFYPTYLVYDGRVAEGLEQLARANAEGIFTDRVLRLPARILYDRGDHAGALSVLEIGLSRRPASDDLLDMKAYTLLAMGEVEKVRTMAADPAVGRETAAKIRAAMEMREGRWEEAAALLQDRTMGSPRSPYPDLLRAIAFLGAGDGARMLAAVEAADRIKPVPDIANGLRDAALRLMGQPGSRRKPNRGAASYVALVCPPLAGRLAAPDAQKTD